MRRNPRDLEEAEAILAAYAPPGTAVTVDVGLYLVRQVREARAACKRLAATAREENRKRWDLEFERDQLRATLDILYQLYPALPEEVAAVAERQRQALLSSIDNLPEGNLADVERFILGMMAAKPPANKDTPK